ncbi:MAG: HAMP domain-containing histidine kinase [Ruminococcaceae bacterium]|nr:HAMP domain-containing histidine kinase [Oscillospiraceae bacterium]
MIKQLRKRFITVSIAAVAGVMLLLFATLNIGNYISTTKKLDNTIAMLTENQGTIPDFGEEKGGEPKPEGGRDFRGQFNKETRFDTRFFTVTFDADGNELGSDLGKIATVTQENVADYIAIAQNHGAGNAYTGDYRYGVTQNEDGSFSAIFVHAEREISSLKTVLFTSLGATVGCILLISVLIILFSKKAMEPVAESYRKQKQFITDASHELKTPITVIGTSLSVLEMEVGKQKWIDKAKAQCDKLRDLVNSLVTLSKMDEEKPLQKQNFNISEAVAETVDSFADFAAESGHPLQTEIAPALTYCGDAYAVRQLTSILIDNAIKYASDGTPIAVTLQKAKKGVVLTTANECDNLDTAELDKLFERFYRADKVRSGEKSGFGIGLSIARSICEAHGGSIRAASTAGKQITFTAILK